MKEVCAKKIIIINVIYKEPVICFKWPTAGMSDSFELKAI